MEELKTAKAHKVLLANRKSANFSGVLDVLSFDVNEILLETEQGMLLIKGNDLHVNRLSLEQGEVDVTGKIDGSQVSAKTNDKEQQLKKASKMALIRSLLPIV